MSTRDTREQIARWTARVEQLMESIALLEIQLKSAITQKTEWQITAEAENIANWEKQKND